MRTPCSRYNFPVFSNPIEIRVPSFPQTPVRGRSREMGHRAGFNDQLVGLGRLGGQRQPALQPATIWVGQDAFDDRSLVDEGNNAHFVLAVGAQERVGFPDFLDELVLLLWGDPAGPLCGDVDDLVFGHVHGPGLRPLEPLAAQLIGIPSVTAHELEPFVRDVLGGRAIKLQGLNTSKLRWILGFIPDR